MRQRIQNIWTAVMLAFGLAACTTIPTPDTGPDLPTAQSEHTNIVVILIDDLSHYGLSTYGGRFMRANDGSFADVPISTPNIDQLARTGLRADYAYTHPLCENTRIALLTGQGNERNFLHRKSQHHSDIMFSDVFKRAGYKTGLFGKWKQTRGTPDIPAKDYLFEFGWDEYVAFDVVEQGQRFINPNLVVNGEVVNRMGSQTLDPETGRRPYGPDIFNREALSFIERYRDEPFLLYYPLALVHDDHKPTPDTQPPETFDTFDEVDHNRDGHTGDDPKYIGDMIAYTDKLIGQVVSKLDELDLRENTLIVVMGDNGTSERFSHILADGTIHPGGKGRSTDAGLHVGLVLNQPGTIPARQDGVRTYDGMVYVTDIFRTITDAAGIALSSDHEVDSISFWPQVTGQDTAPPRDHIYSWYIANTHYTDTDNPMHERFVFNKDFKRFAPNVSFPEGRFFDTREDLYELTGDRHVTLNWGMKRYSGYDIETLTAEQRAAYEALGELLDQYDYVPAIGLDISAPETTLKTGAQVHLSHMISPPKATRKGVLWVSANPDIVSVNKFGEATALKPGTAVISAYSWDDAQPMANGAAPEYLTTGLQDSVQITVSD